MPISPYCAQSGYGTRTYARSNSSSSLAGMSSLYTAGDARAMSNSHAAENPAEYFRAKYSIPEDRPVKSYLTAPRSGFRLNLNNSTNTTTEKKSPMEENRLKKSSSTACFLTGNTAGLLKGFSPTDGMSRPFPLTPTRSRAPNLPSPSEAKTPKSKFQEEYKLTTGRYGGKSSYANAYLARVNQGREDRPKEIDTKDINTTVKPKKWIKAEKSEDEGGAISRNRTVVRLTTKREKPEDPFTIKNKTLQTIAQRLIDKYQVPEKKPEPPAPQPAKRRQLHQDLESPQAEKPKITSSADASESPLPLPSPASKTCVDTVPQDPPVLKTPAKTLVEASGVAKRVLNSGEEGKKEDVAVILQRATNTAKTKKELESWQEVKDAIYAAVIHPDVDIESDEEINKLIDGSPESPDCSKKVSLPPKEPESKPEDKGQTIVGQLKRFVKQQESTNSRKRRSKKMSKSSKGSKKRAEETGGVPGADKNNIKGVEFVETENTFSSPASATPYDKKEEKNNRASASGSGPWTVDGGSERDKLPMDVTQCLGSHDGLKGSEYENSKPATDDNKTTAQGKSCLLSADLILGSAAADNETKPTKSPNRGEGRQSDKTEGSSRLHDGKRKSKPDLPSSPERKNATSLLSTDLVLSAPGDVSSKGGSKNPLACTENTDPQTKPTKAGDSITKPAVKEIPRDVPGTKIPKIKKKIKTPTVVVEGEASGSALQPSGPPAAPPSGSLLPSPSSSSPAQLIHPQDAPSETHKKEDRDTPAPARTADTQASDLKMDSPSAFETLKSIIREEVECSGAKDSPSGGKAKQVTAGNSASDTAAELETRASGGVSCLTWGHKNEKAAKVESSEPLEAVDKGLQASKFSSTAFRYEEGAKNEDSRKKEQENQSVKGKTETNAAKDEALSTKRLSGNAQDKRAEERKTDGLTKVSGIPRWITEDKRKDFRAREVDASEESNKGVTNKENNSKIDATTYSTDSFDDRGETKQVEELSNAEFRVSQAIKDNKQEDLNDSKGKASESSERDRDKDDDTSLKGSASPLSTVSEGGGTGGVTSPDTLPVKRALKRIRQVAPPPVPEKDMTNELLKARNILKRPGKLATAAPAETIKQDQTNVTELANRPLWNKPISPLNPPSPGDQFLQTRNILKRPLKPKVDDKTKKEEAKVPEAKLQRCAKTVMPCTSVEEKNGEGGYVGQDVRGRVLRKQRPAYSRSASSSSSSGDEDFSNVRKEKPKRLVKSKPTGMKATQSPKRSPKSPTEPAASPLPPAPESPCHCPVPEISTSGWADTQDHEEDPATGGDREGGKEEKAAAEALVAGGSTGGQEGTMGTLQSADSGYGSCPSTPLPTPTAPLIKDEEEKCPVCGTNCHKKCEKQMPNLCGVNQKLLAEALSSVKKGGSTDGTTRTLASPPKACSSSVSGSEAESTEEETDTTDTDSDFFGLPEIRPPLQSCPKFKKYNVDDFQFIKVLGKGSYGKVMLAKQAGTENYFAVKCLKKDVVLEDNDVECTLIERKVLSLGTKHPYLCHLFCTFQTQSHLFFVMEYLTGGDLMFHIQHCGRFDEFRACFYGAEITSGLKFLHGKGIIYRDLKLDNILLDYQGHIRIADFGMCKLQVYLDRYADTFCGTPDYMAPEVIKGQHYNQCVDWWSFGVLLYEMLTGKSPFKGCDEDHLFWLICNDEPFFPKFLSKEATAILKQLLDKDSTRRLGIPFSPYGEITVHPFFKYIDWNKIERKEVETPYKPRLRHILDVQYFDPLFTKRQAAITPLDESILATMDQKPFKDFSYTNPNITD